MVKGGRWLIVGSRQKVQLQSQEHFRKFRRYVPKKMKVI